MTKGLDSARHAPRAPGAVPTASADRTPRQAQAAKRRRRRMMFYLALGLLRDRGFRENAVVAAITVAALVQLARERQTSTRSRLAAWWNTLPAAVRREEIDQPAIDRAV
jgi:hypothetical protein